MMRPVLLTLCLLLFQLIANAIDMNAHPSWKVLGPGGGGAQYIPTVSPHDPRRVLVACDMTGAYLTHDAGKSGWV